MKKLSTILFRLFLITTYFTGISIANTETIDLDESNTRTVLEPPIYVSIKPAFVVNYGGPGRLQYLKIEISLRVANTSASNAVRHHMPLIRDHLVRTLGSKTNEDLETREGKERLRITALKEIQNVLMEEDGKQGIINLFFNNFVIQR